VHRHTNHLPAVAGRGWSVGLVWLLLGDMVGQKGDDGGVAIVFHSIVLSSARDRDVH